MLWRRERQCGLSIGPWSDYSVSGLSAAIRCLLWRRLSLKCLTAVKSTVVSISKEVYGKCRRVYTQSLRRCLPLHRRVVMPRPVPHLTNHRIFVRRLSNSSSTLQPLRPVNSVLGDIEDIDVENFRKSAFIPERPLLIRARQAGDCTSNSAPKSSIPAAAKWFSFESTSKTDGPSCRYQRVVPCYKYLDRFQETVLPYELTTHSSSQSNYEVVAKDKQSALELSMLFGITAAGSFHRFSAPLALFLKACKMDSSIPHRLYIAQAQIAALPRQLQDDLPTPTLVKAAGNGDIYDANIWIGLPPTYTPLHRDPNPNLFVQLASSKKVRLYEPSVGARIFWNVQRSIGQSAQSNLRGDEMMEGPERDVLDEVVWGRSAATAGFETVVDPGDALFIPKGWWHTIKSIGTDVTASVNWWFR